MTYKPGIKTGITFANPVNLTLDNDRPLLNDNGMNEKAGGIDLYGAIRNGCSRVKGATMHYSPHIRVAAVYSGLSLIFAGMFTKNISLALVGAGAFASELPFMVIEEKAYPNGHYLDWLVDDV